MATRGRPRIPEDQLKLPRRVYKPRKRAKAINTKKASERLRKLWKPITDVAMAGVLTNDSLKLCPIKNKMRIKWGVEGAPEGFPRAFNSRYDKDIDKGIGSLYTCDYVLDWLFTKGLSDLNASMVYQIRRTLVLELTKIEMDMEEVL